MKTEYDCIDMKCTHYDGDMCTLGFCEPDILSIDLDYVEDKHDYNNLDHTIVTSDCTITSEGDMKIYGIDFILDEHWGQIITNAMIEDDNGVTWLYDWEQEKQIRCPEADDCPGNGYYVNTFDEAILKLRGGGYI